MKKKLALVIHSLGALREPSGVKGGANHVTKHLLDALLERQDIDLLLISSMVDNFQYKNLQALECFEGSIYADEDKVWPQLLAIMDRYPEYEFLFSDIMSPVGHLLLHCQSVPHRISRLPQWLKVIKGDKAQAKLYRQQQDLQNKNRRFLMVSKQLEQDYITHFKLPEAHCQVAYPGVTTQNHSQPNPLTPVPVIGMVGSRSVNKGCWLLLLALWGLILCQQPFKLVLIHPNLAKDLLSRCLLAPIRWFRSVTVLPFQINLEPFYEQLHVFVLPSNNEGFGLVTLEAMAKGAIPIVASTAGSAELIEHGHNGFVFQREKRPVLALFNCLRAVCQLPEPAFSHVQNNALATAQQATWQGFAATVVDHVFAEAPEHTDGLKASA